MNKYDFLAEFELKTHDWEDIYDRIVSIKPYGEESYPSATDENFQILVGKYNKLIELLSERLEFDDN